LLEDQYRRTRYEYKENEGGDPRQGTLNEGDRLYIPGNYPKRVVILVILLVAMAGTSVSKD
jgi:hypothetical protein